MGAVHGDELNIPLAGKNYGWPVVSNGDNYDETRIPDHETRPEFAGPIAYWHPAISPSGLAFYTGSLFKGWMNNLLLGSYRRYRAREAGYKDQLDYVFQLFPRLQARRKQMAGTLSGGERQMLAVGRALMAKPALLMLDEPSLGLAPLIVKDIFHIIERLRESGVATLLIEQNARAALQVADYGYVLETGDMVLEGPAADLAQNPKVIETYLGFSKKPVSVD